MMSASMNNNNLYEQQKPPEIQVNKFIVDVTMIKKRNKR